MVKGFQENKVNILLLNKINTYWNTYIIQSRPKVAAPPLNVDLVYKSDFLQVAH